MMLWLCGLALFRLLKKILHGEFLQPVSVFPELYQYFIGVVQDVFCVKHPPWDPCSYKIGTHLVFPAHAGLALGSQKGAVSFVQQSCHFFLVFLLCMKYHTKCCGITLLRPSEVIVPQHYLSCSCNLLRCESEKIEILTKHEGTSAFLIKILKQMGRYCLLVMSNTINVLAAQKKKIQNKKIFFLPDQFKKTVSSNLANIIIGFFSI